VASIHREVVLEADPKDVWAAVRDVAAPVTFANGLVARELIVDVDYEARRFAWAVTGSSRFTHYNASMQVLDAGEGRTRFF
jgi:hypothetical protein